MTGVQTCALPICRFVYRSLVSTLDEMLEYDAMGATLTALTLDAKEGTQSFMDKRDAQFKGV